MRVEGRGRLQAWPRSKTVGDPTTGGKWRRPAESIAWDRRYWRPLGVVGALTRAGPALPDAWDDQPTHAGKLAAWTKLSAERFGDAYSSVSDRSSAKPWQVLAADLANAQPGAGEAALIRAACDEAERHDFLEALAQVVANIEEGRDGRAATEVGALLQTVAGSGVMQAMTNEARGLMDAAIFGRLHESSRACAIVFSQGQQQGTAFLVGPDLVMTAAHVVLQHERDPAGRLVWLSKLLPNLTFSFTPAATDPSKQRVIVPAAPTPDPVALSLPHGTPRRRLSGSLKAPAGQRLDFALVRLARQVEHVPRVEIATPGAVELNRPCFVFGFPEGTALKFDADVVTQIDTPSGRLLHLANTKAGMSGGCCIGPEGTIVGLHEGTLPVLDANGRKVLNANGEAKLNNRGVSLAAIRDMQCKDGSDPLVGKPKSQGIEFSDPSLVETLYKSGLRFAGPALESSWRSLMQALLGLPEPPGDGIALPAFHPWLRRQEVEAWIDSRRPLDRLCYIWGDEGVGKSFCAQILRGKLDNPAVDLVALNATQTTALSWEEAIGPIIARSGTPTRTEAGTLRYDDVPAITRFLARTAAGDRTAATPLYVAIDFGAAEDGVRFGQTPWQAFIEGLAREEWARVMLIGLTEDERIMIDDVLEADPVMAGVASTSIPLRHLDEESLKDYGRKLAVARGKPLSREDVRDRVATLWSQPMLLHGTRPALQTVEAVLTAMAFERLL